MKTWNTKDQYKKTQRRTPQSSADASAPQSDPPRDRRIHAFHIRSPKGSADACVRKVPVCDRPCRQCAPECARFCLERATHWEDAVASVGDSGNTRFWLCVCVCFFSCSYHVLFCFVFPQKKQDTKRNRGTTNK